MTEQSFWALKMSKKSILGPSYGVTNWAEIQKFLCPSDSQQPDDRFEPLKCPKSSFQAQVIGVWKKVVAKWGTKWRGAHFKQPPQAQILTKSKNVCAHQIENCQEIILGIEIFKKRSFLAWVLDNQILVQNRGTFCPVFTSEVKSKSIWPLLIVVVALISLGTNKLKGQKNPHWVHNWPKMLITQARMAKMQIFLSQSSSQQSHGSGEFFWGEFSPFLPA